MMKMSGKMLTLMLYYAGDAMGKHRKHKRSWRRRLRRMSPEVREDLEALYKVIKFDPLNENAGFLKCLKQEGREIFLREYERLEL